MAFDKRAYMRIYNALPKSKAARAAYDKANSAAAYQRFKAWNERNPEKKNAHDRLNDALRYGRITKSEFCTKCGTKGRVEGHHADYSKPLEVVWLCKSCHMKQHPRHNEATDNE